MTVTIAAADITEAGGLLMALADKSCHSIATMSATSRRQLPPESVRQLDRIIVHTDPHLDEYFAELLFRSALPSEKWHCEFQEQSIFSATNDLAAKHLWPKAAVLGIGSTAAGGVAPLFLFDEHVSGQSKIAPSCSQIVADSLFQPIPSGIATVLREVNVIDEYGGGHPQHLNNLIKTLHEVRFWFGQDPDGVVRDTLTPEWKRAIVDACLAAVVACLHEGVDLVSDPAAKKQSLLISLDNYIKRCIHVAHPRFADAAQRIRSLFSDQDHVFRDAVLRDRNGLVADPTGHPIPQLLILSRICFACEHHWGAQLRDVIATHFWEEEFQKQLNFYEVESAVVNLCSGGKDRVSTAAGLFTRTVLPEIAAEARLPGQPSRVRHVQAPVWLIGVTPAAGVFKPNQAISNVLNKRNSGCGLILIRDLATNTSALFKGSGIPPEKWKRLVDELVAREGDAGVHAADPRRGAGCWYVAYDSTGGMAPFVLNGTKSHQYVPRSTLDLSSLTELVKRTFY